MNVTSDLLPLEAQLYSIGFTTQLVRRGSRTAEIKTELAGQVLVTRRGRTFSSLEDMKRYHYGLVWVRTRKNRGLAVKVEKALTENDFIYHLVQVVEVR